MTSVKTHGPLSVGTVAVRRKPALTYQSPSQSSALSHPENYLFTPLSATAPPLPTESLPTRPSQMPELSQRSAVTHQPSRHHLITPLLPLYHPFGTLALSLPDLDPTAFGLPAPVAVFDDPTRRASNRQRRPAAKARDADDPTPPNPPSFVAATPTPESEIRDKPSPRRRRGGGPGGKRRRREPEDGDATYPAKRPRNSRSAVASGTRAVSREEGSPALSNTHSRASPDLAEEKKPERRSTRSRGAVVRRDSTTSEDTETSATPSVTATNTTVPPVVSSGEPAETDEPVAKEASKEAAVSGIESRKADVKGVLEQQEN